MAVGSERCLPEHTTAGTRRRDHHRSRRLARDGPTGCRHEYVDQCGCASELGCGEGLHRPVGAGRAHSRRKAVLEQGDRRRCRWRRRFRRCPEWRRRGRRRGRSLDIRSRPPLTGGGGRARGEGCVWGNSGSQRLEGRSPCPQCLDGADRAQIGKGRVEVVRQAGRCRCRLVVRFGARRGADRTIAPPQIPPSRRTCSGPTAPRAPRPPPPESVPLRRNRRRTAASVAPSSVSGRRHVRHPRPRRNRSQRLRQLPLPHPHPHPLPLPLPHRPVGPRSPAAPPRSTQHARRGPRARRAFSAGPAPPREPPCGRGTEDNWRGGHQPSAQPSVQPSAQPVRSRHGRRCREGPCRRRGRIPTPRRDETTTARRSGASRSAARRSLGALFLG